MILHFDLPGLTIDKAPDVVRRMMTAAGGAASVTFTEQLIVTPPPVAEPFEKLIGGKGVTPPTEPES